MNANTLIALLLTSLTIVSGSESAGPADKGAIVQEPIIVKLKQDVRRSPTLQAELAKIKSSAAGDGLKIEQWFVTGDGLVVRMRSTADVSQTARENILHRLNALPSVEIATTASGAAGQIQPALLTRPYLTDADIPEARLRGFREFDKASSERQIHPKAAHTFGVLYVQTKEEALFGADASVILRTAAADHARLGNHVKRVINRPGVARGELVEFNES